MKGKGLRKRYAEWIQALSALLLIAMAGLTLHDMQTAEGAGLYLAIKAGAEDRRMYDFAVDAAGMLCLLLLLLLFEQALGVGVVVLRLSIRRIQTQRLLVAFERLAVFLLAELRIAQIEERLGPLVIAAQRVGRRSPHGLLGIPQVEVAL